MTIIYDIREYKPSIFMALKRNVYSYNYKYLNYIYLIEVEAQNIEHLARAEFVIRYENCSHIFKARRDTRVNIFNVI